MHIFATVMSRFSGYIPWSRNPWCWNKLLILKNYDNEDFCKPLNDSRTSHDATVRSKIKVQISIKSQNTFIYPKRTRFCRKKCHKNMLERISLVSWLCIQKANIAVSNNMGKIQMSTNSFFCKSTMNSNFMSSKFSFFRNCDFRPVF